MCGILTSLQSIKKPNPNFPQPLISLLVPLEYNITTVTVNLFSSDKKICRGEQPHKIIYVDNENKKYMWNKLKMEYLKILKQKVPQRLNLWNIFKKLLSFDDLMFKASLYCHLVVKKVTAFIYRIQYLEDDIL